MHSGVVGLVTIVKVTLAHTCGFVAVAMVRAGNTVRALGASDITGVTMVILVADALFALALAVQVANLAIQVLGAVEALALASHIARLPAELVFALACTQLGVAHAVVAANRTIVLAAIGVAAHLALRVLGALDLTGRAVEGVFTSTSAVLLAQTIAGALLAEPATRTGVDRRDLTRRPFPLPGALTLSGDGAAVTMPAFSDMLTLDVVCLRTEVATVVACRGRADGT
jgi:hypothetical protein